MKKKLKYIIFCFALVSVQIFLKQKQLIIDNYRVVQLNNGVKESSDD